MMKQPAILFIPVAALVYGSTHTAQNAIFVEASGCGGWGSRCGSGYRPWSSHHRHRRHFSHNNDFAGFDVWFNPSIVDSLQDMIRKDRHFEIFTKNSLSGRPNTTVKYSIDEDRNSGIIDVAFEVPGIAAQDISVELENKSVLHVQGRRHGLETRRRTRANRNQRPTDRKTTDLQATDSGDEEDEYLFDKAIMMGNDIDENTVTATLSNGILHVQLSRKKKIIKSIPIIVMNNEPSPKSSTSQFAKRNIPFMDSNEEEDDSNNDNDNADDEGNGSPSFLDRIGFPSREV